MMTDSMQRRYAPGQVGENREAKDKGRVVEIWGENMAVAIKPIPDVFLGLESERDTDIVQKGRYEWALFKKQSHNNIKRR